MIARKSFFMTISLFTTEIIGMIGLIVIAKFWGRYAPEALGVIGFAMSFLALFSIISKLGYPQAHIKKISEGKDIGACIGTFIVIKLILTGLMVSAFFIYLFIWKNILKEGFYDATTESVILVFVGFYVFFSLQGITINTFTATGEIVKKEIPTLLGRIIKTPLIILISLAGVTSLGISPAVNWPSFFIPIENVPLTPTGKVDRKALPGPELAAGDDYVAPEDEVEKKLVKIWSEVLQIDQGVIGVEHNFFELGGHSLKGTVLISKIHREFNVSISLGEIFKKA